MKLPERFAEVSYVDRDGQLVPKAVDSKGNVWLQVEGVPAMGASVLQAAQTEQPSAQHVLLEAEEGRVESTHYVIEWNTDGQLTAVFSKDLGQNILKGKGNVFQLFEDKPMKHDAWDIDIFYQEKCRVLKAERIRVSENNPLFASIQFEYSFGQSRLTQEMKLYHHTPRIDFETEMDWKERQQLLKVGFEVDVRANHATYDMQYGNLERANNWNTSWDYAKFETVGHQWADLSQRDFGVSLLNDSKYGYDVKDNVLRLSLLKGAISPDPDADIGKHAFTYSLLPYRGDFLEGKTVTEAWDLNNPLTWSRTSQPSFPAVSIDAEYEVAVDALKKAEDQNGWILRLHDYTGGNQTVAIDIEGINWWNETNLMEKDISPVTDTPIELSLTPYEIKTIRIGK